MGATERDELDRSAWRAVEAARHLMAAAQHVERCALEAWQVPNGGTLDVLERSVQGVEVMAAEVTEHVEDVATARDAVRKATLDGWVLLEVCVDCVMVAANGEHSTDEHRARYLAAVESNGRDIVASCPDIYGECHNLDGECTGGGFRWGACDWCGDGLGGDRVHVALERAANGSVPVPGA